MMKKLTLILIIIALAIFISGCTFSITGKATDTTITGDSITGQCMGLLTDEGYAYDYIGFGEEEPTGPTSSVAKKPGCLLTYSYQQENEWGSKQTYTGQHLKCMGCVTGGGLCQTECNAYIKSEASKGRTITELSCVCLKHESCALPFSG